MVKLNVFGNDSCVSLDCRRCRRHQFQMIRSFSTTSSHPIIFGVDGDDEYKRKTNESVMNEVLNAKCNSNIDSFHTQFVRTTLLKKMVIIIDVIIRFTWLVIQCDSLWFQSTPSIHIGASSIPFRWTEKDFFCSLQSPLAYQRRLQLNEETKKETKRRKNKSKIFQIRFGIGAAIVAHALQWAFASYENCIASHPSWKAKEKEKFLLLFFGKVAGKYPKEI